MWTLLAMALIALSVIGILVVVGIRLYDSDQSRWGGEP